MTSSLELTADQLVCDSVVCPHLERLIQAERWKLVVADSLHSSKFEFVNHVIKEAAKIKILIYEICAVLLDRAMV